MARPEISEGTRREVLDAALPELAAEPTLLDTLLRELGNYGLIPPEPDENVVWSSSTTRLNDKATGNDLYGVVATDLGRLFLAFIDPPWPPS